MAMHLLQLLLLQALLGSLLLLFLVAPAAPRPMLSVAATNVALQLATVVSHLTIVWEQGARRHGASVGAVRGAA